MRTRVVTESHPRETHCSRCSQTRSAIWSKLGRCLRLPTAVLGLVTLLATPSCFRVDWARISNYTPIPEESSMALKVGESGIDDCLEWLGSPLWVLEHPIAGHDGALFAWGWFSSTKVGLRLSFAFDRAVNTSVEYKDTDANMEGIVAIFDEDWVLVELKRGLLKNLTTEIPKSRPRAVLSE